MVGERSEQQLAAGPEQRQRHLGGMQKGFQQLSPDCRINPTTCTFTSLLDRFYLLTACKTMLTAPIS